MERERIFEFLAGFNVEFDQVCVQILGKETLPSFNEVFSLLPAEEGRRTMVLEMPNSNPKGFAVMITKGKKTAEAVKNDGQRSSHRDNLWCNYCKK